MDVERHVVTVDGNEQKLPLKEFELLEMFLRNPGRVLTRGQLIDRVWGSDYVGDTKTLDVHVKRLRAKLEPDPSEPKYLVTVRGLGTSSTSEATDHDVLQVLRPDLLQYVVIRLNDRAAGRASVTETRATDVHGRP